MTDRTAMELDGCENSRELVGAGTGRGLRAPLVMGSPRGGSASYIR